MDRAKSIFGNPISDRDYAKAVKGMESYRRKFGDDSKITYTLSAEPNRVLDAFGAKNLVIGGAPYHFGEKDVVIGNIRMGFGHYRISMAMASAAKALGYNPLWFDLHSFKDTTCGKVIRHQNDLYSLGSRLSQKSKLFNIFWEYENSEGFRKLTYNAADQKKAELMAPVARALPKDIPYVATHVWPAQAAVHAGLTHVVNAIPDNWPMGLHLAEGAKHTIQTPSSFLGYKSLRGMAKAIFTPHPAPVSNPAPFFTRDDIDVQDIFLAPDRPAPRQSIYKSDAGILTSRYSKPHSHAQPSLRGSAHKHRQ